jgi:hypothetical protein
MSAEWQYSLSTNTTSATTWNGNVYTVPAAAQMAYTITPVQPIAPPPRTEVERLLGEVEAVCALAR